MRTDVERGKDQLMTAGYPFSSELPNPGIETGSPALQAGSLPTELSAKPKKSSGHQ